MKRRFYRWLGHIFLRLAKLRNRAWEEHIRRRFGRIHPTAVFEYPLKVSHPECIHLGRGVRVSWHGALLALRSEGEQFLGIKIFIDDNCYLGNHVQIVAAETVSIGKNSLLADRVHIFGAPGDKGQGKVAKMEGKQSAGGGVEIGPDSWIGENVIIRNGVRIGRHCVVGANAVVDRDLPSFSVAVGVPARVIKRYNIISREWERTHADGSFLKNSGSRSVARERGLEHQEQSRS